MKGYVITAAMIYGMIVLYHNAFLPVPDLKKK